MTTPSRTIYSFTCFRLPKDGKAINKVLISNGLKCSGPETGTGFRSSISVSCQPLPGRDNIVITSKHDLDDRKDILTGTLDEMMRIIEWCSQNRNVYIIGGASIYNEFIHKADRILLTRYSRSFDLADTYFPIIPKNEYTGFYLTNGTFESYPYMITNYIRNR